MILRFKIAEKKHKTVVQILVDMNVKRSFLAIRVPFPVSFNRVQIVQVSNFSSNFQIILRWAFLQKINRHRVFAIA